ncbi:MAG: hypothetical protein ACI33I_00490, partial [Clostridium sp.]
MDTSIIIPSTTENLDKRNKLTNLDDDIVFRFLELSKIEAPNCVLGFYLMFYGGLRAEEVCQLMDADVPSRFPKSGMFYVNLKDEITNPDSKYADFSKNKRNRKQGIIVIPELFEPIKELYKKTRTGTNPVVINKYGKSMTVRGYYSNLMVKYSQNPYNVAVASGDSSFGSVLPYIAESEDTSKDISNILSKVY